TTWYFCEGPYSRTDLAGLAEYHHQSLQDLATMGQPIASELFKDLIDAEQRLGPKEPIVLNSSRTEVAPGFEITMSVSSGTRRQGFEILRDIVTQHRRQWASDHLKSYIRGRWESDLTQLAKEFSRRVAARGKPPTAKQFAPLAAEVANHWFGGDIAA